MGGIRILTFNCWHGLDGAGIWRMGELETPLRRAQRLQDQLEDFSSCGADLCLLQEVNPLKTRAQQIQQSLKYDVVTQGDLSGVKLFGFGPPLNLHSGLAIVAKPELNLRKLRALQLSGPRWGVSTGTFALQTEECRYAVFADITHAQLGRLLIVNLHLHHGLETHSELCEQVLLLAAKGEITQEQSAIVMAEMERARVRRLSEITRVLTVLEELRSTYDGVIIGGDFNSDECSPTIQKLKSQGFVDVSAGRTDLQTWDEVRNPHNFQSGRGFHVPLSDFGIASLRDAEVAHLYRPRKLDYIFVNEQLSSRARTLGLFGAEHKPERMTSDHFGLIAEIAGKN